nr:MAG TPA: hypothetical protein [Caudoviricetes sp.]
MRYAVSYRPVSRATLGFRPLCFLWSWLMYSLPRERFRIFELWLILPHCTCCCHWKLFLPSHPPSARVHLALSVTI